MNLSVLRRTARALQQRHLWKFAPTRLSKRKAATPKVEGRSIRGGNKSKNKRDSDHGNARETNTHSFQRDNHAHPQIALGGIGRESGAARKGTGAERDHQ